MNELYPKRAPNMASRVLKGEAIIMNPDTSSLFNLNEVGTVIWQASDGRRTLQEIVETEVCPRFEIDPDQALNDAHEFVSSLAAHAVLMVSEVPPHD